MYPVQENDLLIEYLDKLMFIYIRIKANQNLNTILLLLQKMIVIIRYMKNFILFVFLTYQLHNVLLCDLHLDLYSEESIKQSLQLTSPDFCLSHQVVHLLAYQHLVQHWQYSNHERQTHQCYLSSPNCLFLYPFIHHQDLKVNHHSIHSPNLPHLAMLIFSYCFYLESCFIVIQAYFFIFPIIKGYIL